MARGGERHLLKRLPRAPHPRGARGQAAVYQATGLNLAEQGAWLIDTIGTERAQLVVFDSLRSLAPSIAENDGDTVLPVTATLRCIARQTGAAVLVLHHRPKHRPGYRGSSVLRDQQSTVAADPRGGCAAQGAEEGSHAPRAIDTASGWALMTNRRWRGVACTFGVGAHRLLGQRHGLAETRRPEQAFAGRQRGTSVQAEQHLHLKPTGLGGAKSHAVAEPQHPDEPEPWTEPVVAEGKPASSIGDHDLDCRLLKLGPDVDSPWFSFVSVLDHVCGRLGGGLADRVHGSIWRTGLAGEVGDVVAHPAHRLRNSHIGPGRSAIWSSLLTTTRRALSRICEARAQSGPLSSRAQDRSDPCTPMEGLSRLVCPQVRCFIHSRTAGALAITAIISRAHLDATVREGSWPGRSEQAWRNFLGRESGTFTREAA